MTRLAIIAAALFVACDQRADELLVAGIQAVLEEPKASDHAADCARGSARYGAPGIVLTVACSKVDAGRKAR